ncbi:MAG: hypothetical protein IJ421_08560 [Prevotella sp.]|nr:hypothetical protein [Prevotella sp.]
MRCKILLVSMLVWLSATCIAQTKTKCLPKAYIFGFAESFNDSTLYITEIQEIDSVWVNNKNSFLVNRDEYAYQLRDYLAAKGETHRTCTVVYRTDRKKAEKKYNKMKAKSLKRLSYNIIYVKESDFRFRAIKP